MGKAAGGGSGPLWRGTCRSRFAVATCLAIVALAVVTAALVGNMGAGVPIALAGAFVLTLVEIRVELWPGALRIRYAGPLRWPSQSIPLAEVEAVEAIDVDPRRYGGWGYRGSLRLSRRAALNLRRGPGLRLALRHGRTFVVTVDGAGEAVQRMRPLLVAGVTARPGGSAGQG
jgi:hypothetical protein